MPKCKLIIKNISPINFNIQFKNILRTHGFKIIKENISENEIFIKTVLGSKLKTYLFRRFVPFSKLMKSGQRCGCECRITKKDKDIISQIKVIPYMELLNRKEIPLITQSFGERWVDNRLTKELYQKIITNIKNKYFEKVKIL